MCKFDTTNLILLIKIRNIYLLLFKLFCSPKSSERAAKDGKSSFSPYPSASLMLSFGKKCEKRKRQNYVKRIGMERFLCEATEKLFDQ